MLLCSFRRGPFMSGMLRSPGVRLGAECGSMAFLPPGGVEVGRGKGWERPGPAVLVWRRGEDPPVPGSPSTRILTIGNNKGRTSLLVQWLRLCSPHSGGQSSIPGQETRSHMPQLKISHAARKIRSTILCAAMYIQLSQINSKKKKKKRTKANKECIDKVFLSGIDLKFVLWRSRFLPHHFPLFLYPFLLLPATSAPLNGG